MNLQQLQYIVALDRHRHFVKAAGECGISQPTLSAMITRLEEELDIRIFDRSKHPVEPTPMGVEIINQARLVLKHAMQMQELVRAGKENMDTRFSLGVIPTVAPYIIPQFIGLFKNDYPRTRVSILEMRTNEIIRDLKQAKIDIGLLATPLLDPDLLEIPLYYEKFVAYIAPSDPNYNKEALSANELPLNHLWVLQEGHCLRNQIFNFCTEKTPADKQVYEAGSIDNLVRIIDNNGGYTLIPRLHLPMLDEVQAANVRLVNNPPPVREISIVVYKDFFREGLLNAVANTIKQIIPADMLDTRLKKFAIRL
ncbi:MAG: hydrogen peroxide-inducible genes activator [Bacteroidales bacterium]|nr:hydrogen peroxide-inducible genes activator [Bacteroidales bacterium]MDD3522396.1 hydrogen peroxide-inducible genes activator [Bacteroidales bacterium]MDD4030484.1 hydrogen peroxide-inducible genes activator [Bacteroidales bacterium]MDD4435883.1 hydrogen peroxide-inducible genes activator [Bacteroidales bacterium]MDD5732954.1 hydrogen peroxide-inducible genes activator [Bacteroidales bacterium]